MTLSLFMRTTLPEQAVAPLSGVGQPIPCQVDPEACDGGLGRHIKRSEPVETGCEQRDVVVSVPQAEHVKDVVA